MSATETVYCVIVHAGSATATEAANPSGACSGRTIASGSGVAASHTLAPRTLTRASERVHASMKRRSRLSSVRIVSISWRVKKRRRMLSAFGTARSFSMSTPTGATRVTAIIDTPCECEIEKCSAGSLRSSGFPLGASYNSICPTGVPISAPRMRRVASRTVALSPLSSVRTRTSSPPNGRTASFTQSLELDQLHCCSTIIDRHDCDTWCEIESPSTCGAGIHDHAAREAEDQLPVRVAIYNDVRIGVGLEQLLRLGPAQLIAMAHVQAEALERMFESHRQVRIIDRITVSSDSVDRSDRPQLVQDVIAADVAGVQDQIDAGEG